MSGDNRNAAEYLAAAILDIYSREGVELEPIGNPIISSWWQKFRVKIATAARSDEVIRRLEKAEAIVETALLQEPLSKANAQHAAAFAEIAKAMDSTHDCVIYIGNILYAKNTLPDGRIQILSKNLTTHEMVTIEKNPGILSSPSEAFALLQILSAPASQPKAEGIA